jgi:hydroxymethylglutaryl-CoA lyase
MADTVSVVEVSPRDGLQNEPVPLPTTAKIELIGRLMAMGARRIEAASFVSPRQVPQMSDAEAVLAGVPRQPGVSLAGLVLNERGFDRAVAARVDEINYVIVATETFSRRNQGVGCQDALRIWAAIAPRARAAGLFTTVTIGAAFGCPFEGEVSVDRVAEIAARVADAGVDELALADTIGVSAPTEVTAKLAAVAAAAPGVRLRCHFHNTRNTGIANAYAAAQAGVGALDTSLGGIGGCPFAPLATGNIPTEDVAYLFGRMGVATGIDLAAAVESVGWLSDQLGKPLPGMLARAGLFPPPATGEQARATPAAPAEAA